MGWCIFWSSDRKCDSWPSVTSCTCGKYHRKILSLKKIYRSRGRIAKMYILKWSKMYILMLTFIFIIPFIKFMKIIIADSFFFLCYSFILHFLHFKKKVFELFLEFLFNWSWRSLMVWLRDSTVSERFATYAISVAFCSIRLRTNSSVILIDIQTTFFPVLYVSILQETQYKTEILISLFCTNITWI